jgi:hypothetical protein
MQHLNFLNYEQVHSSLIKTSDPPLHDFQKISLVHLQFNHFLFLMLQGLFGVCLLPNASLGVLPSTVLRSDIQLIYRICNSPVAVHWQITGILPLQYLLLVGTQ